MSDPLKAGRARRLAVAVWVLVAALPASHAWGGWQRDLVCRGSTIGNCGDGSTPTVPDRPGRNPNPRTESPSDKPRALSAAEERRIASERAADEKRLQEDWLPITAGAVEMPGNTVSIAPGSRMFNIPPSDPASLTAPIAGVAMKGTPIPEQALRRAATILAFVKVQADSGSSQGGEEQAFLASQAALAMEGAPLQIIVAETSERSARRAAEALRPVLADLAQDHTNLDQGLAARKDTIKAYASWKAAPRPESAIAETLKRHEELASAYDQASDKIRKARAKRQKDGEKVEQAVLLID